MKHFSKTAFLSLAMTALAVGCVAEGDEAQEAHQATEQAVINPGESAQVVESSAGESLTMPGGPTMLGVLEGQFKIKRNGVWSTVGRGLYMNVAEASCISPGRIAAPPGNVLYSRSSHVKWYEWSSWVE
jgi:hypothetical protein